MRVQCAVDMVDRDDARALAKCVVDAGLDCLEAGHLPIKVHGLDFVKKLRSEFREVELVADMKTMDTGAEEVRAAAQAGADAVIVCAGATDGTVQAAIEEAERCGVGLLVSLMGVRDAVSRTKELLPLGVNRIIAHRAIDDNRSWSGGTDSEDLKKLIDIDGMHVALGGGLTPASISDFTGLGLERVIIGRGVAQAPDRHEAARRLAAGTRAGSG